MKQLFFVLAALGSMAGAALCMADEVGLLSSFAPESSTAAYGAINEQLTSQWQGYGEPFIKATSGLFSSIYLALILGILAVFLLHYLIVGAKHFDHSGPGVPYFGIISRIIHWIAAVAFTLLVITGLVIIFGRYLGGGAPIMFARLTHLVSALVFAPFGLAMLAIWFVDMLPAWHDVKWVLILGGYLSKEKKPVPAGRFNAGQKMWFWFATAGGVVMAYSGYQLYLLTAPTDQLQLWALVHNVLAMVLVAFFLTHLYMALFAIAGSIHSMIDGTKPSEEVAILHSRYRPDGRNPI